MRSFKLRASIVARIWISEDGGDDGGGGGTTPEWLPDGAVAFADFVNGHYYAGGAETTAAAALSNPSLIEPGTGLVIPNGTTPLPHYLGGMLDALLAADLTVVLDVDLPSDGGGLLLMVNNADDSEERLPLSISPVAVDGVSQGYNVSLYPYNLTESRSLTTGDLTAASGRQKIALSNSDARSALSWNGGGVVTDETAYTVRPQADRALIGGYLIADTFNGPFTIRSLTVYALKSDADLPALSALS